MRWRSLVLVLLLCAGCARDAPRFSLENARAHVQMLAGTIGSRPVGTAEDARARAYIIDQLHLYGFDVRVQETDARRPELGLSAHVNNIIAIKAGDERGALALVSHYDSAPSSPGGADDGLGVAVSLEAARVLAARDHRRHALMILLTDGEEAGLMGAAGLADDRDVMSRLQAYINIEAIGSSGTAMLFEAGPGNGWLVRPWIRAAPHPRGASYGLEIYKRLPNDTDFSILKRHDIPGLNFAPIGDSYAYHTARDTADRLSDWTLRATGENTVNTAAALDAQDLKRRSTASETFFDIGQTVAIGWGPVIAWLIAAAALVVGLLAWFKTIGAAIRLGSLWRWLLQVVWSLMGAAAVIAAMVGISWALRASRTVYHPWYASPGRFFILIAAAGALAGWIVVRAGAWLPEQARLERHPLLVWSLALPLWIALTGGMAAVAPGAGYLWSLPLLIAGAGLLAVPLTNVPAIRGISIVVLAVAGTLWLRDTLEFLQFLVPMFGRLPIVTPIWAYAALIAMCGAMVMPPLLASVAAMKPVARPSAVTAALVLVAAIAGAFAYAAPAYTSDRPQRREMRVIVDEPATTATFEVASQEPGLDLNESAPAGWYRATDAPQVSVPVGRYTMPFVFRTVAASPGPSPAMIGTLATTSASGALEASLTITPQATGLTAIIELPPGLQPIRANLPGMITSGRWRTTFVAVPPEGLTWRASFVAAAAAQLAETRVAIVSHRFPNGGGWQSLPAWLPQEHTVWSVDTMWIATPGTDPMNLLARLGLGRPELRAWAMYDWAHAAFQTTIIAAIFPIYFQKVAAAGLPAAVATSRFAWATTIAILVVAVIAPLLGTLADYAPVKKKMLGAFLAVGATATALMFFIHRGDWRYALVLFVIGNIGVAGAFVFCEALLPHIARPEELNRVSAAGYGVGYIGGGTLLGINILMLSRPGWFLLADRDVAVRACLASVAVWWTLFSIPLFRDVPEPPVRLEPGERRGHFALGTAIRRLIATFQELRRYKQAFLLLVAFLVYNDGIQTIIRMATTYGAEIGIDDNAMIFALLITQFIGVPFAFLFGMFGDRIGAKRAILAGLFVYACITVMAYFMRTASEFFALAVLVGMVQGGTQALSRSLFASMIPKYQSSEFFAFFGVFERYAGILGPALFAWVGSHSGTSRNAILSVLVFFIVGGALLPFVNEQEGRRAASAANS